ncbi:DNA (cytosine-5-)-methyltransferase, partial [Brevibacillus brevis]|uniref:DNA cytosine methyltransferase n=1 Tax=Brevibacillus brevis TaxID=1393 RepID=UPI001F1C9C7B
MRMLSLFAGIGGIDLAAHWAGIETVAFCEIEPFCQKVLQKHWPRLPIFDDVRTINKQQLIEKGVIGDERAIDIICGGYPCQPFSNAGQRLGEEDDRHLWPEMLRLIRELRPTWVLGENVDGHVTLGLDIVLSDLDKEGYTARAFIIPAAAVYAPHQRKRVFIVAHSTSERCRETRQYCKRSKKRTSSGGKILAHTKFIGPSRQRKSFESVYPKKDQTRKTSRTVNVRIGKQWSVEPRVGGDLGGLSDWLDRFRWPAARGKQQYDWEPERVTEELPASIQGARLKSLGNAVNPAQVFPILWAIKQTHDQL